MTRLRRSGTELLTGEWAVLGLLNAAPSHGFALAKELAPGGDIGRIWSLSRPLTYRAIDQLLERGFIEARAEQPGRAGGNRTIYAATRTGRSAFRTWVTSPVDHLRELRSELLLKLVLAQRCSISVDEMIASQLQLIRQIRAGLETRLKDTPNDLVLVWRMHAVDAAVGFLVDLDTAAP
ncbi:MAG: PadR family transcriptional regulator [Actinomycetota bacterium]